MARGIFQISFEEGKIYQLEFALYREVENSGSESVCPLSLGNSWVHVFN